MSVTKIQGIVINNIPLDENSRIITTFTKQLGKVVFYAQGVNKIISKNKYSIQTFSLSDFEIFKARNDQRMSKLKTGELKQYFNDLTDNYTNYVYGAAILKIVDVSSTQFVKNYKIYNMLLDTINALNNNDQAFKTYVLFLFYFLKWIGGQWILDKCGRCNIRQNNYKKFNYKEHHLVCSNCMNAEEKIHPKSFVTLFTSLDNNNFYNAKFLTMDIVDLIVLHKILVDYYEDRMGYYINSFNILKDSASMRVPTNKLSEYF